MIWLVWNWLEICIFCTGLKHLEIDNYSGIPFPNKNKLLDQLQGLL